MVEVEEELEALLRHQAPRCRSCKRYALRVKQAPQVAYHQQAPHYHRLLVALHRATTHHRSSSSALVQGPMLARYRRLQEVLSTRRHCCSSLHRTRMAARRQASVACHRMALACHRDRICTNTSINNTSSSNNTSISISIRTEHRHQAVSSHRRCCRCTLQAVCPHTCTDDHRRSLAQWHLQACLAVRCRRSICTAGRRAVRCRLEWARTVRRRRASVRHRANTQCLPTAAHSRQATPRCLATAADHSARRRLRR